MNAGDHHSPRETGEDRRSAGLPALLLRSALLCALFFALGYILFHKVDVVPRLPPPPDPIGRAEGDISSLTVALKAYYADVDFYPGFDDPPGTDSAPKLYEAIFGKRPVDGGGGGPNAPYHHFPESRIAVKGGPLGYQQASDEEREDPTVDKFILDPWGYPYHYSENDSKPEKTPEMHRPYDFDIWSNGPDREDDRGLDDDVAGWQP